jgi:alkylation response protein AidB-like acyl-CoA dehydrogenase
MGFDADFSRRLARRGWVGVTLPKAYGGAELDAFCRFVLVEELLCAGAPVAAHWIADRQSGPLILRYGTEAQRRHHLSRICAAQAFFCIGMSEPGAGSDLASVNSRATRTPEGWRLNGRKLWTTHAHHAHYMIALVRTSGQPGDRHKGLSQLIVDLSLPGVEDALVGSEGQGWGQVTAELAFERSGPERLYSSIVLLELWVDWLRRHGDGSHAEAVGRFATELAALRQLSISVTARLACGDSPVVEAALVKDLGTEFEQAIPAVLEAALGDPGAEIDGQLVRTLAYVSQVAPTFSLRGGTREILRGMIARGLGLR